jgi:triosephosphate isomerase
MKKKLIIGNWKLNPTTLAEAQRLAAKIERNPKHTAVICPPAVFLSQIDYPRLGAQDCFWAAKGAYTGQVSALQLKSLGVKYCLVGHSERRAIGESDEMINAKVAALLSNKLVPVLCIGFGTTVGHDDLEVIDVLRIQLKAGLRGLDAKKVIVAYEPVWAISSGDPYATKKVATPDHVEKISLFIKSKFGVATVLYGGSANASNTASFLAASAVDGLLVGGASLLPDEFNKMINIKL